MQAGTLYEISYHWLSVTNDKVFYRLHLGQRFYALTENLSKSMQCKEVSAVSSQCLTNVTIETIEKIRSEEATTLFSAFIV